MVQTGDSQINGELAAVCAIDALPKALPLSLKEIIILMSASVPEIEHIWPIAELLRGDYKRSDYGKVILPFTVLRRLDCILAPTKADVLKALPAADARGEKVAEYTLNKIAKQPFHNRSPYNFAKLLDEPNQIAANLSHYINGFSANIREILEYFSFAEHINRLDNGNGKDDLLYKIVQEFNKVSLHPSYVDTHAMGNIFEELIRRFSEQSNETAGEHFTPREVIKLMVNLLFLQDRDLLSKEGIVRTLYDPACGTGGMLSIAEDYLRLLNSGGRLELFGQELNPESYAICKSDMLIKGHEAGNIKFGNSFTSDGLRGKQFDYMLSNPPFGVEWKKVEKQIRDEYEKQGAAGRFGAGLPRISDGSLLFLQHMLAKRNDTDEGTRIAIVFNGSPLFSGGAGSGESEIRRWIITNDWLEAIVGLPDQLFYNTGISTYLWILTNRKPAARVGKIQLVDGTGKEFYEKMPKSLGNKRNRIGDGEEGKPDHISNITRIYGSFTPGRHCKIFDNEDFGYRRITVERPLRLNFQLTSQRTGKVLHLSLPDGVTSRAWQALSQGYDKLEFDETLYRNMNTFLEVVMQLYVKASITPPNPKQFRQIVMALGERDPDAEPCYDEKGEALPDANLRDFENVPLKEDIRAYFAREVTPHVPDAWISDKVRDEKDGEIGIVGYEIPFTRHFYEYKPLRTVAELEAEIEAMELNIRKLLGEVLK